MRQFTFNLGIIAVPAGDFFVPSSLITEIQAHYEDLVTILGEPHIAYEEDDNYGDGKVDAEWVFKTNTHRRITVYNYKDGKNYLGKDGLKVRDIRNWHIGGDNTLTGEAFAEALELQCERLRKARK